jgi:TIGR01777 family protein
MKVLITGATGFVGRALTTHLSALGHKVEGFSRPSDWNPDTGTINPARLEGVDAVIHLAGENIASGRWTAARKTRILDSRKKGTRLLADALARLQHPPKVLVSASAIGYYGDHGNDWLDEDSRPGNGFLPEVCREWEHATAPAKARGIRVVNLRIGIVLGREGGALAKMILPFRLGAGGRLGNGRQYMSWITLHDLCRAVNHVLTTESLEGPVNAVSPSPVTNREFTSALAATLCRPAVVPVPRFAVRLGLGELADELLLASIRVRPARLSNTSFRFEDTDISVALGKNVGAVSTLRKTQWIARPPHEVFPFFADANNLERITPPWLKFRILNPGVEMQRGALINYRLHVHGIPLCWQSEITEWEPPYRFVDVQRRGPYSLWVHEHRFEPHDGGTLVQDTVQYAAPGGTLLRQIFIDRDLDSIFKYRRQRLEEHFA